MQNLTCRMDFSAKKFKFNICCHIYLDELQFTITFTIISTKFSYSVVGGARVSTFGSTFKKVFLHISLSFLVQNLLEFATVKKWWRHIAEVDQNAEQLIVKLHCNHKHIQMLNISVFSCSVAQNANVTLAFWSDAHFPLWFSWHGTMSVCGTKKKQTKKSIAFAKHAYCTRW